MGSPPARRFGQPQCSIARSQPARRALASSARLSRRRSKTIQTRLPGERCSAIGPAKAMRTWRLGTAKTPSPRKISPVSPYLEEAQGIGLGFKLGPGGEHRQAEMDQADGEAQMPRHHGVTRLMV